MMRQEDDTNTIQHHTGEGEPEHPTLGNCTSTLLVDDKSSCDSAGALAHWIIPPRALLPSSSSEGTACRPLLSLVQGPDHVASRNALHTRSGVKGSLLLHP